MSHTDSHIRHLHQRQHYTEIYDSNLPSIVVSLEQVNWIELCNLDEVNSKVDSLNSLLYDPLICMHLIKRLSFVGPLIIG